MRGFAVEDVETEFDAVLLHRSGAVPVAPIDHRTHRKPRVTEHGDALTAQIFDGFDRRLQPTRAQLLCAKRTRLRDHERHTITLVIIVDERRKTCAVLFVYAISEPPARVNVEMLR